MVLYLAVSSLCVHATFNYIFLSLQHAVDQCACCYNAYKLIYFHRAFQKSHDTLISVYPPCFILFCAYNYYAHYFIHVIRRDLSFCDLSVLD